LGNPARELCGKERPFSCPISPYLDFIRKVTDEFGAPTFASQVNGEIAEIMAAALNSWIDRGKDDYGKPQRLQARRRRRGFDVLRPARGTEAQSRRRCAFGNPFGRPSPGIPATNFGCAKIAGMGHWERKFAVD
jgi:hypothetical protein